MMPELQRYEYVWLLDTDAFLLGPLAYDVFGYMAAKNATYGAYRRLRPHPLYRALADRFAMATPRSLLLRRRMHAHNYSTARPPRPSPPTGNATHVARGQATST